MRTILAWTTALCVMAGASGCLVVSADHRDEVRNGEVDSGTTDGGMMMPDTGLPEPVDTCGMEPNRVVVDTTRGIIINTMNGFTSSNSQSCGAETPGADAFIGIDVVAGSLWHFHLAERTSGRQPMLYLTEGTRCDSRTCQFVSTSCDGSGDEHFAFEATANGRWYIGIDDGVVGGGEYTLEAYRLQCGDNQTVHGEGCDDGNRIDGDGCDRQCRFELSELRSAENEPNDNRVEANSLRMPPSNTLTITGNIGGAGACRYADFFAVSVPSMGDVVVDALNPDGTVCATGSTTPFRLALVNGQGDTVVSDMQDTNGCAIINAPNLSAGTYYVRVFVPEETVTPAAYRLRVAIQP